MQFIQRLIFYFLFLFIQACQNPGSGASDPEGSPNTTDTTGSTRDSMIGRVDSLSIKRSAGSSEDTLIADHSSDTAAVARQLKTLFNKDLSRGLIGAESRKFIFSKVDLNDDGTNEMFVGFTGPYFCGSGGCTMLLLNSSGSPITRFTVSEYPVLITIDKYRNWKSLLIRSRGNYHLVKYNGSAYPANPSVQPLVPGGMADKIVDKALDPGQGEIAWHNF